LLSVLSAGSNLWISWRVFLPPYSAVLHRFYPTVLRALSYWGYKSRESVKSPAFSVMVRCIKRKLHQLSPL
jgi:hypothetical protein